MVGRACRVGLLLLLLLEACGFSAGYDAAPDGAVNAASIDETLESGIEAEAPSVESPCFHNAGAEAWTCDADGVTLTRTRGGVGETLQCPYGCVPLPDGFDSQCRPRDGALGSTVNGHPMTDQQASWVSYFAWCAVPLLQGTRDDRLTAASIVAWWALKEGVLDASHSDPVGLSLCRADRVIGPLDRCAYHAPWQVGASGVQASCCSLRSLERTAAALFPGMTEDQVLSGAAVEAGYPVGTTENLGIVGSTGSLRASWLLHVTAIGFLHQGPIVTDECIKASRSWCYGAKWPASASYAPDKSSAMRSMSDLRVILDVLSP
jgi:hypothetical protein